MKTLAISVAVVLGLLGFTASTSSAAPCPSVTCLPPADPQAPCTGSACTMPPAEPQEPCTSPACTMPPAGDLSQLVKQQRQTIKHQLQVIRHQRAVIRHLRANR